MTRMTAKDFHPELLEFYDFRAADGGACCHAQAGWNDGRSRYDQD